MSHVLPPEEQRQKVEKELRQHAHRVDRIKEEIRNLNNELRIHNILLSLGRDEKLLSLLNRLRDDEALSHQARDGGRSFFEQHGVELPPEIQTVTSAPTIHGVEIRGVFQDDAGREFEVTWNSHDGFGGLHPDLRAAGKKPLNPDLYYSATRTQLSTDFMLTGKGFQPGGQVALSIFMEPGRTVPSTSLGSVTANGGEFQRFHRVWYLPGADPQTRNPTFIARDVTYDQPAIEEAPSAYWYA